MYKEKTIPRLEPPKYSKQELNHQWENRVKMEQKNYLQSIKAGLDLGKVRNVKITPQSLSDKELDLAN